MNRNLIKEKYNLLKLKLKQLDKVIKDLNKPKKRLLKGGILEPKLDYLARLLSLKYDFDEKEHKRAPQFRGDKYEHTRTRNYLNNFIEGKIMPYEKYKALHKAASLERNGYLVHNEEVLEDGYVNYIKLEIQKFLESEVARRAYYGSTLVKYRKAQGIKGDPALDYYLKHWRDKDPRDLEAVVHNAKGYQRPVGPNTGTQLLKSTEMGEFGPLLPIEVTLTDLSALDTIPEGNEEEDEGGRLRLRRRRRNIF